MKRLVAALAIVMLAAPMGPAWAQATTGASGAPPLKPATPAQIRALKGLFPKPGSAVGTDLIAPADAAYYDCMAKRLYMPLSRMLARTSTPSKEQVSTLIASRANEASCGVAGDDRDYIGIKPAPMLEATARYAETWKPPTP